MGWGWGTDRRRRRAPGAGAGGGGCPPRPTWSPIRPSSPHPLGEGGGGRRGDGGRGASGQHHRTGGEYNVWWCGLRKGWHCRAGGGSGPRMIHTPDHPRQVVCHRPEGPLHDRGSGVEPSDCIPPVTVSWQGVKRGGTPEITANRRYSGRGCDCVWVSVTRFIKALCARVGKKNTEFSFGLHYSTIDECFDMTARLFSQITVSACFTLNPFLFIWIGGP